MENNSKYKLQISRMEIKEKIIIEKEAVEKVVEEKMRKMLKKIKDDGKRKNKEIKDLKEEVKRMKKRMERMEQSGGKRKREDSDSESKGKAKKRKCWAAENKKNDEEKRRRNIIIKIEKERWEDKESNWEKVKDLLTEGLRVKTDVKEVSVVGQRGDWLTILVKLENKENKRRVLEARKKAGKRIKVKIDEDKWR